MINENRIKGLREKLGWSQAQMGKELGVSQPTIWRFEAGEQTPSKSVEKLIAILESSITGGEA